MRVCTAVGGLVGLGMVGLMSGVTLAAPVTLVNETFEEGVPAGLNLFSFGQGNLEVKDGALRVTGPQGSRFGSAPFTPVTLGIGDTMSFSFDIRGNLSTPGAVPGFKIGIFGSGETKVASADDGDAAADDFGYTFGLISSSFFSSVLHEDYPTSLERTNEGGGFIGGTEFIGTTRSVEMQITRRTDELYRLVVLQDGVQRATSDFARSPTDTFDNIQFGLLDNVRPDEVFLDNIRVTYTAVPEPGSLAVAMAAGGLLIRRRR